MSNRPASWYYNTTLYWTIYTYDSSGNLVDADSTPTVDTFIDGVGYGTVSVAVTKRSGTTGIYDCSFAGLPTANSFGTWQFEEEVTISGTAYVNGWSCQQADNNAQQVADAVLDEPTSTHQTSGSLSWRIQDTNTRVASTLVIVANQNDFDPTTDTVANVALVGSVTNAVTTANASDVTAVKAVTDKLDTALVLDGAVYQYTVNALENAPSGGGGGGDATLAKQNTIISDIAALNDFNPSSQTVANVTTVGTCVSNSDMRGTDNANTLAPANGDITGIKAKTDSLTFTGNDVNANVQAGSSDATAANQVAIQNAIAALNDFDPGSDTVANVTDVALVAVCTTNSDMRGTDAANTVAPDNAGITSNGLAIAALNDFDPASDVVADVTNVATTAVCVSNSDMRGTDGANTVVPDNAGISSNGAALATTTKTGVQYTATAQSGDTIQVTLS